MLPSKYEDDYLRCMEKYGDKALEMILVDELFMECALQFLFVCFTLNAKQIPLSGQPCLMKQHAIDYFQPQINNNNKDEATVNGTKCILREYSIATLA